MSLSDFEAKLPAAVAAKLPGAPVDSEQGTQAPVTDARKKTLRNKQPSEQLQQVAVYLTESQLQQIDDERVAVRPILSRSEFLRSVVTRSLARSKR
ncbi:hypothetical protein OPU71_10230 [Niveibacterium sp. 24ML]|uniref:hypothetical protein n=1 Tax=Niveibacterium sp. 24ML TaxID=2985512 RepID=UPI00226F1D5B|nr:hypothetical protein [Niveibacterium sp. 24ML]MCX9156498.1 hypothetical protein [Niveibacterium sp. 24ML]